MMPFWLVAIALWLLFAGIVGEIADRKGRDRGEWFLFSALFSPLLGAAIVIALPDPRPQCPACGTHCPDAASACRGCGRDLPTRAPAWTATAPSPLAVPPAKDPRPAASRAVMLFVSGAITLSVAVLGLASWMVVTA